MNGLLAHHSRGGSHARNTHTCTRNTCNTCSTHKTHNDRNICNTYNIRNVHNVRNVRNLETCCNVKNQLQHPKHLQ